MIDWSTVKVGESDGDGDADEIEYHLHVRCTEDNKTLDITANDLQACPAPHAGCYHDDPSCLLLADPLNSRKHCVVS
jgi:hypothetical protein